ncbi:MAG: hypothetical protein HZC16_04025 [Candidatus Omnitrophica bacterium]|nr:hypothetical protein [Candidatus Omnitrophota bacterium]
MPEAKTLQGLSLYIIIYCLIINVAGCTKVVVQPTPVSTTTTTTPEPASEPVPEPVLTPTMPEPVPEPKSAPSITSIRQSPPVNGTFTLTINGSGFDSGAIAQIYNSSGKHIGSGGLSGKPHNNQMAVKLKDLKSGKYTVKVKNQDGQFSNAITLIIPKPVPPPPPIPQCTGNFSKEPKIIYLGGGDAIRLFERYLAENSGIKTDTGNFDIKIKFYEKEKAAADILPQTVCLNDSNVKDYLMKSLFESWEDFLNEMKKRLKGRVAEFHPMLSDEAIKENADYFQCPAK